MASNSPAELVAIIRAARMSSDRELERSAKRELADRFGITLKFSAKTEQRQAVTR